MEKEKIERLLDSYKDGVVSREDVLHRLKDMPFEDLDFAKIDHHRVVRNGFPEVIFCHGKTISQITAIFKGLSVNASNILLTRASPEVYAALKETEPGLTYHDLSRLIVLERKQVQKRGKVLIIAAGTADIPVAEEAQVTASLMGCHVETICDVGVAGLPRLLAYRDRIFDARCIIAIAGMDGACVPVTAGLAQCPIIAVPTSTGYGANLQGLAPLLTMLNSCAPGVGVVNIDNGFGAGYLASMIVRP
jgi:pyridinium-3,5-biscarboxylic acid mononucleotide synthase